jgi:hypothetical protein
MALGLNNEIYTGDRIFIASNVVFDNPCLGIFSHRVLAFFS